MSQGTQRVKLHSELSQSKNAGLRNEERDAEVTLDLLLIIIGIERVFVSGSETLHAPTTRTISAFLWLLPACPNSQQTTKRQTGRTQWGARAALNERHDHKRSTEGRWWLLRLRLETQLVNQINKKCNMHNLNMHDAINIYKTNIRIGAAAEAKEFFSSVETSYGA